jgi:hypothetical protein
LAVGWVVASLTTGIAIGFSILQPSSLLFTLSHHRDLFIFSNGWMIATQLLVAPLVLGLVVVLRPTLNRPGVVLGLADLAASSLLFIMSAACHTVYGTVPAKAIAAARGARRNDIVLSSDVLHHVADFFYFLGIAATAAALVLLARAMRESPDLGRLVAGLAIATAVAHVLQFGWLLDVTAMESFGIVGIVLQVILFAVVGLHLLRAAPAFAVAMVPDNPPPR